MEQKITKLTYDLIEKGHKLSPINSFRSCASFMAEGATDMAKSRTLRNCSELEKNLNCGESPRARNLLKSMTKRMDIALKRSVKKQMKSLTVSEALALAKYMS